jgi:hypothetical protein
MRTILWGAVVGVALVAGSACSSSGHTTANSTGGTGGTAGSAGASGAGGTAGSAGASGTLNAGGGAGSAGGGKVCLTSIDCGTSSYGSASVWCIGGTCRSVSDLWMAQGAKFPETLSIEGLYLEDYLIQTHTRPTGELCVMVDKRSATGGFHVQNLAVVDSDSISVTLAGDGYASVSTTFTTSSCVCTDLICAEHAARSLQGTFMESTLSMKCTMDLSPAILPVGQVAYANNAEDRRWQGFVYDLHCSAVDVAAGTAITLGISSSPPCGQDLIVSVDAQSPPDGTCKDSVGCMGGASYPHRAVDPVPPDEATKKIPKLSGLVMLTSSSTNIADEWPLAFAVLDSAPPKGCPGAASAPANCGNGVVEPDEFCDGSAPSGLDCVLLGFTAGTLACTPKCTLDTSQCRHDGAAGAGGGAGTAGSAGTGGIGGLGGAAGAGGSAGAGGIGGLGGQSGAGGSAGAGGTTSLTIGQLRDPAVLPNPALGDSVTLAGVVVTGVRKPIASSNGFYVSDEVSGPWHCIFVHTGATVPAVSVGDRVNIAGVLGDYNGLGQIANGAVITVVASGAPLPELNAAVVDLVGANAEAYESCRVRLQSVTGATMGTAVGLEQAGWQIRASPFIWSGSGAFVSSGTTYSQVKGFVNYYQTPELIPQFDSDLVSP